jgi:hypothetical protein
MNLLKDIIPNIIVFNPTNDMNNAYTGIVPKIFIHKDVNLELLESINERQKEAVSTFNMTNNKANLYGIFLQYASNAEINTYKNIMKITTDYIEKCNNSSEHLSKQRSNITTITKIKNDSEFLKKFRNKFNNKEKL